MKCGCSENTSGLVVHLSCQSEQMIERFERNAGKVLNDLVKLLFRLLKKKESLTKKSAQAFFAFDFVLVSLTNLSLSLPSL